MSDQNDIIDREMFDLPKDSEQSEQGNGRNRILNDSSIFYKGLIGMILCIVPAAIVGLVLIKISLDQAKDAIKEIDEHPSFYRQSSISIVRRGRTFAYIGLGLFIVEIIALMTFMSMN
jgi:hypothetical protein